MTELTIKDSDAPIGIHTLENGDIIKCVIEGEIWHCIAHPIEGTDRVCLTDLESGISDEHRDYDVIVLKVYKHCTVILS